MKVTLPGSVIDIANTEQYDENSLVHNQASPCPQQEILSYSLFDDWLRILPVNNYWYNEGWRYEGACGRHTHDLGESPPYE